MKHNVKIYIHTHKNIENILPLNKDVYVITAQNRNITDDRLPVLYIDDEFTNKWKTAYGELTTYHYLWTHPDILPDYVGVCHYRRFFTEIFNNEEKLDEILDKYDRIVPLPAKHFIKNSNIIKRDHSYKDLEVFDTIIKKTKYSKYWDNMLNSYGQYLCNLCILPKKEFMELCDFLFNILYSFNETLNLSNDEDVVNHVKKEFNENIYKLKNFNWQCRLHGFYGEWLSHAYFISLPDFYKTTFFSKFNRYDNDVNPFNKILIYNINNLNTENIENIINNHIKNGYHIIFNFKELRFYNIHKNFFDNIINSKNCEIVTNDNDKLNNLIYNVYKDYEIKKVDN